MLFPIIDVRPSLLSNSKGKRYGKRVEEIDIDMTTATSALALEALKAGHSAMCRYDVETARRRLCEASELARKQNDAFVEAATVMLLTIQADGTVNSESQPQFLEEAFKVIDYEVFVLNDRFTTQKTATVDAKPILLPRLALKGLIEHNLEQYRLRQKSLSIADTRNDVDRHLAEANWFAAENVSSSASQNAVAIFGERHWWRGVMLTRQATALLRQQKPGAKRLVKLARGILLESSLDETGFQFEWDVLRTVEADLSITG